MFNAIGEAGALADRLKKPATSLDNIFWIEDGRSGSGVE
jgi:hypothetical protein